MGTTGSENSPLSSDVVVFKLFGLRSLDGVQSDAASRVSRRRCEKTVLAEEGGGGISIVECRSVNHLLFACCRERR